MTPPTPPPGDPRPMPESANKFEMLFQRIVLRPEGPVARAAASTQVHLPKLDPRTVPEDLRGDPGVVALTGLYDALSADRARDLGATVAEPATAKEVMAFEETKASYLGSVPPAEPDYLEDGRPTDRTIVTGARVFRLPGEVPGGPDRPDVSFLVLRLNEEGKFFLGVNQRVQLFEGGAVGLRVSNETPGHAFTYQPFYTEEAFLGEVLLIEEEVEQGTLTDTLADRSILFSLALDELSYYLQESFRHVEIGFQSFRAFRGRVRFELVVSGKGLFAVVGRREEKTGVVRFETPARYR